MIKKILLTLIGSIALFAQNLKDSDLDGVIDSLDKCPNTPFLHQVDENGCTIKILQLPSDSDSDSLFVTIDYDYSTNSENSLNHRSISFNISYYKNSWIYSLDSGYYKDNVGKNFEDTKIKIKRQFKLNPKTKIKLGVGLTLPTDNFKGNKTDFTLYSSLIYYYNSNLSIFSGESYTFVRDDIKNIRNSYNFYAGVGYFFTDKLYSSISLDLTQSRFKNRHLITSATATLYYQINEKIFTSFTYNRELDEDTNHAFSISIGYKFY